MFKIDLNCDIGESFGNYKMGHDEEIMRYISSANIACGYHAGDPATMNKTVKLAIENGVSIGAHPGLPDLQGFGRRTMSISAREVYEMTLYQVGALHAFVVANGGTLRHIKPHGALYNMAAVDVRIAEAIAEAVYHFYPKLILYGLSGGELVKAGKRLGLRTASEVFADCSYQYNGTLTPRTEVNSVITEVNSAILQAMKMVKEQKVMTVSGTEIFVKADTLCLHGDGANALNFARDISKAFAAEKISIEAL